MRKTEYKWKPFNPDGSEHVDKNTLTVSQVLAQIHYPAEKEIPKVSASEMSLELLDDHISEKIKRETKMQLSVLLHSMKGFGGGPKIKKEFDVRGTRFVIVGKLDKLEEDDNIIEAKFAWTYNSDEKNLEYARDQCDIYGWITGKITSTILVHNVEKDQVKSYQHMNNFRKGEKIVRDYVEKNML